MKRILLAAVASLALTGTAQAVTTTFDFNAQAAGGSLLNTAPTGFTVSNGTVDIVKSGEFSITCAGGGGGCVDLDGTTNNAGIILSNAAFTANAGNRNTVSLQISGNQRGFGPDDIFGALLFDPTTTLNDVTVVFDGVTLVNGLDGLNSNLAFGSLGPFLSADPFKLFTVSFTTTTDSAFQLQIGANGVDNVGVLIDNLTVSAVPEPATWAMMIGGFGLVGASMRRRSRRTGVVTA